VIDRPARQEAAGARVTILLHKPVGLCQRPGRGRLRAGVGADPPENRWTATTGSRQTWHPGQLRGLAPAGRLDIDSTGLLVLTQDGRVAKLLIGDETRVEKEYLVRVAYGRCARRPPARRAARAACATGWNSTACRCGPRA
jgi:23S rRNA pseudouridine2604 synthase